MLKVNDTTDMLLDGAISKIAALQLELQNKDAELEALKARLASYENKTSRKDKTEDVNQTDVPSMKGYIFPPEFEAVFVKSSRIRRGMFVFLSNGFPCEIVDARMPACSKYPARKIRLTGICLLDDRKFEEVMDTSQYILQFKRIEEVLRIISITDNTVFQCEGKEIIINYFALKESEMYKLNTVVSDFKKDILGKFITLPMKAQDKEYISNIILRTWQYSREYE
jgi:hypothetical protein